MATFLSLGVKKTFGYCVQSYLKLSLTSVDVICGLIQLLKLSLQRKIRVRNMKYRHIPGNNQFLLLTDCGRETMLHIF